MATPLFYFGTNIAALTAVVLTGAGCLISNPGSFNARIFACVTVSLACYLVGRISYAVPADVQVSFWIWPYLLIFMNMGSGFWMILAYSLFQDDKRVPRWMIVACAVQFLLSAINAFGYVGRNSSVLQSATYPAACRDHRFRMLAHLRDRDPSFRRVAISLRSQAQDLTKSHQESRRPVFDQLVASATGAAGPDSLRRLRG
jgi:hypothetical protein